MAGRLEGRVAIVTGGARGIGRAEALLLAGEGAAVVVNGLTREKVDEVVAEIRVAGGRAAPSYDTVVTMEGGARIVGTALASFGRLDIVVNNAGIVRDRMVFKMSEAEWDEVIAVNLKGPFTVTRAASVIFREQRSGRIITTSSWAGLGKHAGQVGYGAAKEGIIGLTRTLARDLGRYGVTVNAIRPNAGTRLNLSEYRWEVAKKHAAAGDPSDLDFLKQLELLKPEAIAPLVVWLCTDGAAHVNGRTFLVMGPTVALYSEPEPVRTLYNQRGYWTVDELMEAMPGIVGDLVNPEPARS